MIQQNSHNLFGFKIQEHPLFAHDDYRIEFYRGVGGYKNRWLVRKEKRIPQHKVIFCQGIGTIFVSPESAAILRGVTS